MISLECLTSRHQNCFTQYVGEPPGSACDRVNLVVYITQKAATVSDPTQTYVTLAPALWQGRVLVEHAHTAHSGSPWLYYLTAAGVSNNAYTFRFHPAHHPRFLPLPLQ